MESKQDGLISKRKRLLWNLLFIVLAVLSVWTVTSAAKGFSPRRFLDYLNNNDPWYLAAAALSMLAYIGFDALMIGCLLKGFNFQRSYPKCLSYAAADLYFSAVTPSATGGQPMEAYFMAKDHVPVAISTAALLSYLLLYTLSIVIIGVFCLIFIPGSFFSFSLWGRILIGIGAGIQLLLVLLYAMLLWEEKLMQRICRVGLKLFIKLHLVHDAEARERRLNDILQQYHTTTTLLRGRTPLLIKALLLNLAHRGCQLLVTVFCFLAGGGSLRLAPRIFAIQSDVVVGACCIPIPGAMGVTDFLMLDGFSSLMSEHQAASFELLARATSFYICILLCGLIVLIRTIRFRMKKTPE